jgi:arylformamidase
MSTLIDLSHPLANGQPSYPGDPPLTIEPFATISTDHYNTSRLVTGTHQGTHVDAPFHFFDDGTPIDRLPLDRFYGPATLVDLAPDHPLEPRTRLTPDLFKKHTRVFRPGARVIYRTGWDRMFGDPSFFTDFPTLTLDAAEWIASRGISLLGMDTPTPSTEWLECHHIFLQKSREILLVESLANLDKVPRKFTFIAFPLPIQGRDASPIRAVAWIK